MICALGKNEGNAYVLHSQLNVKSFWWKPKMEYFVCLFVANGCWSFEHTLQGGYLHREALHVGYPS